MLLRLSTLILLCVNYALSYKVLVYSTKLGFSHMNFLGSIADTLQRAGHNVTVLQPLLKPNTRGTGCSVAKVIPVDFDEETREAASIFENKDFFKLIWQRNPRNPIAMPMSAKHLANGFDLSMKSVLKRKELMEELRAEKFDIAIGEMFDYGGFPIFYELGIEKVVGVISTVLTDRSSWALGLPLLPSFVPPMQSAGGDDGDFFTRLSNVVFTICGWEFERVFENQAQIYMDEHHPSAPTIHEMISNMPFVFTNGEPLIDFPRPTLHKVVDLGGIGLKASKPLDENWLKILAQRKTNVLISFGSVAPSAHMPDVYKKSIIEVVKKFPEVTFIWKYETPEDNYGIGVENLHLSKWTPQTDLLGSGKLNLFVTHGGAGSIMETAHHGVPVVAIPLFGDQLRNAMMAERFGFAKIYDKYQLDNSEELEKAVRFGLENKNLRESAKKSKELLAARPFSPQEKLVRHMDLVDKFGKIPSMTPSGRQFSIIQYHNYDVFAFLAVLLGLVVISILFGIKLCVGFCFNSKIKAKLQ